MPAKILCSFLALLVTWVLFTGYSVAGILTSNVTGGVSCPGDVITFNCTQDPPDTVLLWRIVGPGAAGQIGGVDFLFPDNQPPLEIPVVIEDSDDGTAALLSTSPTVESTLTLNVTAQLNGTRVECSGTRMDTMDSEVITIASPPSPPQNVIVTVVENGTTNVTVSITWDNGGGAVDGYAVQTSPRLGSDIHIPPDTTSVRLVFSYNVGYGVTVGASNCAGSSASSTGRVEFVGCPLPSKPNVTFEPYISSAVGSVIYYKCSPGFIPEGRVMSLCGGDGMWDTDPDQYSCTEVDCGDPRLPENSTVIRGPSSGNRNGSEVTFQCNKGLFPSMAIIIVCTSEERWQQDPEMIVCTDQPATCSRPSEPTNGFLGEVTSTTAEFGCDSDPQETMTAQCVATDTWDPDPAQEECSPVTTAPPVDCGSPQPPLNGVLSGVTGTLEGSEVTFHCNTTTTAVCNRDGRWSPDTGQQVCGFQTAAGDKQVTTAAVASAVVCSVVFYIGGVVSTILVYLAITRCRETRKQVAIGGSEPPNTAPPPPPVYEDIAATRASSRDQKAGIELRENVAYGPVKN